jgi:hypothetical protein
MTLKLGKALRAGLPLFLKQGKPLGAGLPLPICKEPWRFSFCFFFHCFSGVTLRRTLQPTCKIPVNQSTGTMTLKFGGGPQNKSSPIPKVGQALKSKPSPIPKVGEALKSKGPTYT